jgi:hypothetical protein
MVSTTFPPPLFGCVFGTKKWHTSFQHAVKNDQHMMSHRDNRAFLATVPNENSVEPTADVIPQANRELKAARGPARVW